MRIGGIQDVVIVTASSDRLLEDGWIRREPADTVLVDQTLQLAADEEVAMNVVEPDRLAEVGQDGPGIGKV